MQHIFVKIKIHKKLATEGRGGTEWLGRKGERKTFTDTLFFVSNFESIPNFFNEKK